MGVKKKKNSCKGQGLGVGFHPIQGLGGALVVLHITQALVLRLLQIIYTHPPIKRKAMTIH